MGIHTELYIFLQAQLIRLSSTFVHDDRHESPIEFISMRFSDTERGLFIFNNL